MLTFKPLSGAAKSDRLVPLAYLLQVDDVHILLDCGSPDWCPEPDDGSDASAHWETYCQSLKEFVFLLCSRYSRLIIGYVCTGSCRP